MKKLLLLAILAGLTTFSLIVLVRRQNKTQLLPLPVKKSSPAFLPRSTPTPSPSPLPSQATIQGSLSYPSEGIPEQMKVCAEEIETKNEFCTSKHLNDSQFQYGVGYQLSLPAGTYEVFAFLPNQPDQKAYYSEAVSCGLSVDCTSHKPIQVQVKAGETVSNIDPQDWYAPSQE